MSAAFSQLSADRKRLLDELRAQIMQLDREIIEQIRGRRIVYSKNFLLVDFAEIVVSDGVIEVRPVVMGKALPGILVEDDESMLRALGAIIEALKGVGEG